MGITLFHRILIIAAMLFDLFLTLFCVRKYNSSGDRWQIAFAVAAAAVTVALAVYFAYFNRKVALLRINLAARDRQCPHCGYDLRGSLESQAPACPECGTLITDEFRRKAAAI